MRCLALALIFAALAFGQSATTFVLVPYSDASGTGELRFRETRANGQNYVGFQAPPVISDNVMWALPVTDGAGGTAMMTDGAGNLYFDNPVPLPNAAKMMQEDSGSAAWHSWEVWSSTAGNSATLALYRSRGTMGSNADVLAGDSLGGMVLWGENDGSGRQAAAVMGYAESLYTNGVEGRIELQVNTSGGWKYPIIAESNVVYPGGSGVSLGTGSNKWSDVWGTDFYATGSINLYGTTGLNLGAGATAAVPIKLFERLAGGANYVAFAAPAAIASDVTWVLPAADLAGCFYSDGAGTVSLVACSGGSSTHSPGDVIVVGEGTQANLYSEQYSDTPTTAPATVFRKARGTESSPTQVSTNDVLGKFIFTGRDSGGNWDTAAWFQAEADASGAAVEGRMGFYTIGGGDMRLWGDGSVTIGYGTDPTEKFWVTGTSMLDGNVTVDGNVISDARDTDGLGSLSVPWANVTANKLELAYAGESTAMSIRRAYANTMGIYSESGALLWEIKDSDGTLTKSSSAAGIVPSGDNAGVIGNSSQAFASGYFYDLTTKDDLTVTDLLTVNGSVTLNGDATVDNIFASSGVLAIGSSGTPFFLAHISLLYTGSVLNPSAQTMVDSNRHHHTGSSGSCSVGEYSLAYIDSGTNRAYFCVNGTLKYAPLS